MKRFHQMLEDLRNCSSTNKKKDILACYPDCRDQLYFALNPFLMFGVTSKSIKLKPGKKKVSWQKVSDVLNQLAQRKLTGNAAIKALEDNFDGCKKEVVETIPLFLDKDLKCGIKTKLVNSVYPALIPEFNVTLAQKYENLNKIPFNNCYVSRKLDGVRVLAIKEAKKPFRFFSREGREFHTLKRVGRVLDEYFLTFSDIVLDGECCVVDEHGKENFKAAVSEIKRKNHTMKNPKFLIFDIMSYHCFTGLEEGMAFNKRYKVLKELKKKLVSPYVGFVKQMKVKDVKDLKDLALESSASGWEGLMLKNGDSLFEGKRTKNLRKYKLFKEEEFIIYGYEEGDGRLEGLLGAIKVKGEFEGKKIKSSVGSGFKQTFKKENGKINYKKPLKSGERYQLWKNRKSLKGRTVTVRFFDVSMNKDGTYSLRFPTVKKIWEGVRDV